MLQANFVSADENAQKAAVNAYFRNKQYKHTYTNAQRNAAQCALDILHTAFAYVNSYVNYRKTCMAVKITKQVAHNNDTAQLALSILQDKGYKVVSTQQGLIVRIKR